MSDSETPIVSGLPVAAPLVLALDELELELDPPQAATLTASTTSTPNAIWTRNRFTVFLLLGGLQSFAKYRVVNTLVKR